MLALASMKDLRRPIAALMGVLVVRVRDDAAASSLAFSPTA
jgi:hypothetical protein